MISKLVFKLTTNVLATNILNSKLVSKIETNLEHKYLVAKTLVANG